MRGTVWLSWLLFSCGPEAASPVDPGPGPSTAPEGTTDTGSAVVSTPEAGPVGRCDYVNAFSQGPECKEYVGAGWTEAAALEDCAAPGPGAAAGDFVAAAVCDREGILGECQVVDPDDGLDTNTVFPGDDPAACAGAELGCGFLGGTFLPTSVCDGDAEGVPAGEAFVPFQQVCVDPLPGEPPGTGPEGQVCTWQAVSGATEAGRHFADYASCSVVRTQRPYYPYDIEVAVAPDDARLTDAAWAEEYAWATDQFLSTSCSCCHSEGAAPDGPAGWSLDHEPIWIDGVGDEGLAMLAGWVDSTAFGAFPPEENNGFDRDTTGVPTTDVPRMVAFLEGELARRGRVRDDFAGTPAFGGPLHDQLFYEPGPCGDGQGLDAEGRLSWTGGPARYLYVMGPDSASPGVPPNLDLPEGTLWRLDVSPTADPVPSPVGYGDRPQGASQAWPVDGAPPALVSGATYYLVALLDVYQPATRCLFVAP